MGRISISAVAGLLLASACHGFMTPASTRTLASPLYQQKNEDPAFLSEQTFGGYTVKQRLREEVESPFRKVRLLAFGGSVGSALTALYFSALSTIKALANQDSLQATGTLRFSDAPPLDEALTSDGINIGAAVICGVLCYREYKAGQANLKRIAQGGQLASLVVETMGGTRAALKEYRRTARVIMAVGGSDYLKRLAESLKTMPDMAAQLASNDLVLVPVLVTSTGKQAVKEASDLKVASDTAEVWKAMLDAAEIDVDAVQNPDDVDAVSLSQVLAVPRGPSVWTEYMTKYELETAIQTQNIDVTSKGLCIIVKKNGKILRRSTGLPGWEGLLGFMEVADGSAFGMPGDSEKYGGP